jgi:hypothetical protein
LNYIGDNHIDHLLVDIPDTQAWPLNFYFQFAFQNEGAYFQRGILIDNTTEFRNLWLQEPPVGPEYIVVLKGHESDIGPDAQKRAESPALALYEVQPARPETLQAQDQVYQEMEANQPMFPTLAP